MNTITTPNLVTVQWLIANDACVPGIDRFKVLLKSIGAEGATVMQIIESDDMTTSDVMWFMRETVFSIPKSELIKFADDLVSAVGIHGQHDYMIFVLGHMYTNPTYATLITLLKEVYVVTPMITDAAKRQQLAEVLNTLAPKNTDGM